MPDSVYKTLDNVDVWDKERDARNWLGGTPVVAHPPCGQWGRLRQFARVDLEEKSLAVLAVLAVRQNGGVLEHPKGSLLWKHCGLPLPGERDKFGGYTFPVLQQWWGHRAEKATWLYIVGVEPDSLPQVPLVLGEATHVIQTRKTIHHLPHVPKKERHRTPPTFASWLISVAERGSR